MPEQELLLQSGDRFSAVDGKPDEPRDFTCIFVFLFVLRGICSPLTLSACGPQHPVETSGHRFG